MTKMPEQPFLDPIPRVDLTLPPTQREAELMAENAELRRQLPMRCAECDCDLGGANCNWIKGDST